MLLSTVVAETGRWDQNRNTDCTKNGDPEAIIRMEEKAGERYVM